MRDLLLSPLRRLRTRVRGVVFAAAITLAGTGLFWPVVLGGMVATIVFVAIAFEPAGGVLGDWSVPTLLAMLATSWMLRRSRPVWAVLAQWTLTYLVLGLPTLIWASYPSLGGGAPELAFWVVLFGLVVFFAAGLVSAITRRDVSGTAVPVAICVGWFTGVLAFTVVHVTGSPPQPGDWWMAPAVSAGAAVLTLLFMPPAGCTVRGGMSRQQPPHGLQMHP